MPGAEKVQASEPHTIKSALDGQVPCRRGGVTDMTTTAQALAYLLRSIKRSPENINYLIISVFSVVAIWIDVVPLIL